jgi:hypothetical protein
VCIYLVTRVVGLAEEKERLERFRALSRQKAITTQGHFTPRKQSILDTAFQFVSGTPTKEGDAAVAASGGVMEEEEEDWFTGLHRTSLAVFGVESPLVSKKSQRSKQEQQEQQQKQQQQQPD